MNELKLLPIVEETLTKYEFDYRILECRPELADTAAFCEHYNVSPKQAANTLLVATRKLEPTRYAICVVLATTKLDVNKKVSELLDAKKLSFADTETTKNLTGMMIGGVTAIGITGLPIYVDAAVFRQAEVITGGGNRSTKLLLDPQQLTKLPNVEIVDGLAKSRD